MATKRTRVEQLTADELHIDRFTIEVEDRRARNGMIEAVATSQKVDLEPVLAELPRERLKGVSLDDAGRLLGKDSALTTEPPAPSTAEESPKRCETVRAKLRTLVRPQLKKHGFPPDKEEKAIETILKQAELLAADWAGT